MSAGSTFHSSTKEAKKGENGWKEAFSVTRRSFVPPEGILFASEINLLGTRSDMGRSIECLVGLVTGSSVLRWNSLSGCANLGLRRSCSLVGSTDRPSDTHHKRFKRNSGKFKFDERGSRGIEERKTEGEKKSRSVTNRGNLRLSTGIGTGTAPPEPTGGSHRF